MLHLGGTTLPGGLIVTMDALQGTDLVEAVRPHHVLPVHYDDYTVMRSPLSDFIERTRRPEFPSTVIACARGERVTVNAHGPVMPSRG